MISKKNECLAKVSMLVAGLSLFAASFGVNGAFANEESLGKVTDLLGGVQDIVNSLIGIVIALAFFYFFWQLVNYIRNPGERGEIVKQIAWSLVIIVIITSLWGIVNFITDAVGINEANKPTDIQVPGFKPAE